MESNQLLPGFARGNFYEESTKLPSLKRAYVDSTLLVLCAINSMWNQLSFSSGFVRVNFSDDTESTQLLSLKRAYVESTQLLLPTKKLLGSGFSTPYTTFCLICTISSELKCISHLFLSEWAGVFSFVPIRVSREIHSFSVDGFDTR